jgi:hypothetical protein
MQQPQPQEKRFCLDGLTGPEVDKIMEALLKMPMGEVFTLFQKLQGQVRDQMQQTARPAPAPETGNGVDKQAPGKDAGKECQSSAQRPNSSAGTR